MKAATGPAPIDDLPAVLTALEVAAILRISRRMVYKLVAEGDLYSVRVGTAVRIPRAALVAYLAGDTPQDAA